ncbi:hypothetical protein OEG95_15700 [Bacillus subtilis]|uniref:hypothetical protein n=1 Tax=Bacillus subtilis TaxID=1423 RepID=UPI0021F4706C|nr:hypothetical protein [Bacillus subtilis]UYP02463.1 hypothetical protein OEG95_15700 [Bacillus subtilis]
MARSPLIWFGPNWATETFSAYKQVVGGSGKDRGTEEMLLFNYKITQLSLFDCEAQP